MTQKISSTHEKSRLLTIKGGRKKRLCRHMVDIWNKTISYKLYSEAQASLTPKRQERLIWFLEEVLGPQRSWETYCRLVSHCGFLGKVSLDWALIPGNARKILAAPTHQKSSYLMGEKDIPWGDFYEEIKKRCQSIPYGPEWFQICQNLAKRLGQRVYKTWFSEACLLEFEEKTMIIQVDSAFKRDYILTYFFLDVVYAIQTAYPPVNQIAFQVGSL